MRQDHVVDVAALGCHVGVGEAGLVVVDQLQAALVRRRRLGDVAPIDDVDGALGPHDRDLRLRPGEVEVGQHVLRVHDVVGAAVRLAGHDGQLRHRRLGERVQELRPVADDPAPLLARSRQEAGDVAEREQRDVEGVAEADEAGALLGRVDVEHAGELRGLVADYADRPPVQPREPDDDVAREVLVDLEELAVVDHVGDDVAHVVRLVGVVRNDVVKGLVHSVRVVARLDLRRRLQVVLR